MAYQNVNSSAPRPSPMMPIMYNPGLGNGNPPAQPSSHYPAPRVAHSPSHSNQLPHQQLQQPHLYPNAYPPTAAPSPAYGLSAPGPQGPQGQMNHAVAPSQQYPPIHVQNTANGNGNGNGNGGGALMQPRTTAPDDPFKKPYLPPQTQQHYSKNAQPPPNVYPYNQQQSASTSASLPATTAPSPQKPSKQLPNASTSYPAPSSMTVSAPPPNTSAQSTPTSEAAPKATEPAFQAGKLSSLDQERVDAVLNVNNLLLQEIQALQSLGLSMKSQQASGNPQSPQQANQANASSPQSKTEGVTASPKSTDPSNAASTNPSTSSTTTTPTTSTPTTGTPPQPSIRTNQKFVEYMKRVQSNIQFLLSVSDPTKYKRLPYPTSLEPLPNWIADGIKEEDKPKLEALKAGYGKLRELWPDWKPMPPAVQQQQQQALAHQQAAAQHQTGVQQPQPQPQPQSRS